MRKFAIIFLSAAGICGPLVANAALVQNTQAAQTTPLVISVSGASIAPNDVSYQLAHLNGEVTTLQQQVQNILQHLTVTAQIPAQLYPDSVGG
jgi:hypothetical protein